MLYLETEDSRYELSVLKQTYGDRGIFKLIGQLGDRDEEAIHMQIMSQLERWKLRLVKVDDPVPKDIEWLREQVVPLEKGHSLVAEGFAWADIKWWMDGLSLVLPGATREIHRLRVYKYFPRSDLEN